MRNAGLCHIYLVAPTTPDERIELIVKRGSGFIYYVSREGVTGMQSKVSETLPEMTAKIRAHTQLPVAIGFGISTPEQAKTVAGFGDAVVVGSEFARRQLREELGVRTDHVSVVPYGVDAAFAPRPARENRHR